MLQYLPELPDLATAGLSILLFLALSTIGAAVGGRQRRAEFDPLVGWAIMCVPFVSLGTLTSLSFVWLDGICVVMVGASLVHCRRQGISIGLEGWGPYVALALPFLLIVAPTLPNGWDQLSHWIPNTNYIATFQHFPRQSLPQSTSMHAGYPYGFPLAIYWVEMAARVVAIPTNPVGIAACLNVLLFVVAARMLVEQVRSVDRQADTKTTSLGQLLFAGNVWLAAALSLLLMTALSPTFVPAISLSANADNPTTVALLAIAFAVVPNAKENVRVRALIAIQLALILSLNVFLKEDSAVPAVALLAGRIVWDARTGSECFRSLREFAFASIPMLAVAMLWHSYVYLHIPNGEMALRTPGAWRLDLLPQILWGVAAQLVSKVGLLALAGTTFFFASRSLRRGAIDGNNSGAGAFSVIAATGFIAYNLFLVLAYVSIFSAREAERQAAMWRYETHLGLVLECAVILLACTIRSGSRTLSGRLALAVAATMFLAPLVFAPMIRPDLDPQSRAVRAIGDAASPLLAGAKEIYVIDQSGSGAPCPMIVYEAKSPLTLAECITKITPCPACSIREAAAKGKFIWVNGWPSALLQATNFHPPENASYLLKRTNGRWNIVAHWPIIPDKIRGVRMIWQAY